MTDRPDKYPVHQKDPVTQSNSVSHVSHLHMDDFCFNNNKSHSQIIQTDETMCERVP
jgi:hypothetical protein